MDDHTEAEPLKPCPFCGGAVDLEQTQDIFRDRETGTYRRWWGVICRNTGNVGGSCAVSVRPSASKGAAVGRWNRRATQASAPAAGDKPPPVDAPASLIEAARAVVDRWHTPAWKEVEHTAAFIARLDEAVTRAAGAAPLAQQWPQGLLDRVKAATRRISDGHAPRRIPADPTDVDLVLGEVQALIEGRDPPFWVPPAPQHQRGGNGKA